MTCRQCSSATSSAGVSLRAMPALQMSMSARAAVLLFDGGGGFFHGLRVGDIEGDAGGGVAVGLQVFEAAFDECVGEVADDDGGAGFR